MYDHALIRFIDAIALLMLLSTFLMLISRKMVLNIKFLKAQAILLAFLACSLAIFSGHKELFFATVLILVIKAFLIPKYLLQVILRTERFHETNLFVSLRITLLIAFTLVIAAYYFAGPLVIAAKVTARNVLPVALSLMMLGMLMMVVRKKLISHVIGLIVMENGIYLAAVAVVGGMPLVVELGIFFDLLISIVIMAAFSQKIGNAFASLDSDYLRNLKG